MNILWLGQGGFIFKVRNQKICIDPYLSNSVAKKGKFERLLAIPCKPEELDVDLIIATHDHKDHLDEETIRDTSFEEILYVGPEPCLEHFAEIGIEPDRLLSLDIGDTIQSDDITLHGVYADHSPGSIGVVLEYEETTIYIVGDSRYNEKLLEVRDYEPDILVTCINGKMGNMNFKEAARLAAELGVKQVIPCHYGMFAENTEDPDRFKDELKSDIGYIQPEYNQWIKIN